MRGTAALGCGRVPPHVGWVEEYSPRPTFEREKGRLQTWLLALLANHGTWQCVMHELSRGGL